MSNLYQKKAHKRIIILTFFLGLWLCGITFRLFQLQIFKHPSLKAEVTEQHQNINRIIPKRGTIYDRAQNILARSVPRQSVFYTPFKDEPPQLQLRKIKKLKGVLNLSENEIKKIKRRLEKNAPFIWVKRKIDPEKEKKVEKLNLSGIYFMEEDKRFYPQGIFASHLLGRVNIDDVGASGVEYKYNSILQGTEGKRLILRDAKKREYRFETLSKPEAGKDLMLTIDETIQYYAEKALESAVLRNGAKWGTVILSCPSTGEILAMANYPSYNPNNPPKNPSELDRNRAIHHIYEPGSTFKIVTASAALEESSKNFNKTFDCSKGAILIAGKSIRDHQRFEILSFPEVFIHSSNVGTIQLSQSIGANTLHKTIEAYGFGQKTGIGLPAEERGIFRPMENWTKISPASLSIGYEISVTPLQMLQAINIIANKGILIPHRIVKKILISYDNQMEQPLKYKRAISEETASRVASILQEAVERGTGKSAQINGYKVAGKTGTAQKFNPSLGIYSSSSHTASFVGFVPSDKPVLSLIVVLDDPKGQYYGGQVAAPVFREIATLVLRYLNTPQQNDLSDTIIVENYRRQKK